MLNLAAPEIKCSFNSVAEKRPCQSKCLLCTEGRTVLLRLVELRMGMVNEGAGRRNEGRGLAQPVRPDADVLVIVIVSTASASDGLRNSVL